MISLTGLLCVISGLMCNSKTFVEVNSSNFESYVQENVQQDNDKILFVLGVQNIKSDVDLPVFRVEDVLLEKYLGMNSDAPISLISMKNNLTDFNTYVLEDMAVSPTGAFEYDITTFVENVNSNAIKPKTFNQTGEIHPILRMPQENDIYKEGPHATLFFYNTDLKTTYMARLLIELSKQFSITFGCWDMLISDPPTDLSFKHFPSIGMTSPQIYGKHIAQLKFPIVKQTIRDFIEANVREYKKIKKV